MTYQVELSFRAERDLDQILAWLSNRSRQGAASWLRRWNKVRHLLSDHPQDSLLPPENEDHEDEIRHVVFKTRHGRKYRALFVIRGRHVFVTNIRGPGQNLVPPDELLGPNE